MRAYFFFRMVAGVFHAVHDVSFESRISVGQLFYALLVRFLNVRKSLSIGWLSATVGPHLPRVSAQLIQAGFVIIIVAISWFGHEKNLQFLFDSKAAQH